MSYPSGRTHYNKLIRDNVPQLMTAKGVTFGVQPITDDNAFRAALLQKLVEEAREVAQATSPEVLVAEIADVLDVIDTILQVHTVDATTLAAVRDAQNKKKGGFAKRLLLVWSEQP